MKMRQLNLSHFVVAYTETEYLLSRYTCFFNSATGNPSFIESG